MSALPLRMAGCGHARVLHATPVREATDSVRSLAKHCYPAILGRIGRRCALWGRLRIARPWVEMKEAADEQTGER